MRVLKLAALLGLSAACAGPTSTQPTPSGTEYDLVIRNGRVLDGAGNPWVRADIGISKGRIAKLGLVTGKGHREIDASRALRVTRLDRHDGPLRGSPASEPRRGEQASHGRHHAHRRGRGHAG